MTAGTSVAQGDLPSPALPTGTEARRPRAIRLPRSPKILTGLALLLGFAVLAIVGPLLAPDNPNASFHNSPVPLAPSAAHWLGTTALQQDVFSQLLAAAAARSWSRFLAGLVATALSVVIGVTAGYLGGLADDLLSMLANIFLVMPALPLLIILFGFLRSRAATTS